MESRTSDSLPFGPPGRRYSGNTRTRITWQFRKKVERYYSETPCRPAELCVMSVSWSDFQVLYCSF